METVYIEGGDLMKKLFFIILGIIGAISAAVGTIWQLDKHDIIDISQIWSGINKRFWRWWYSHRK